MGTFDFLSSQIEKTNRNSMLFNCPLCGELNEMNAKRCKRCGESLIECQEILFSEWNNYCDAFELAKLGNYIDAFSKISVFVNFYPRDIDGIRFFVICKSKLLGDKSSDYLESVIDKTSDRWIAMFQDNPNEMTKEFFKSHQKDRFIGNDIPILYDAAYSLPNLRKDNVFQLIDLINKIYEIHTKNISSKKQNKGFESFYEKTFVPFLNRKEINLIDFYDKNYNSLDQTEITYLGSVHKIDTSKKKLDGVIFNVYLPSIRYKSLIIQKGEIAFYSYEKR